MGAKYRSYNPNERNSRQKRGIHPVWRGVGFGMMVLIPIMAYAASEILIQQNDINGWYPFPTDLLAGPGDFLFRIFPDPLIHIRLILTIALMVAFFAVFTFLGFLITGIFGPKKTDDPFYVPPITRSMKRSNRRGYRR